MLDWKKLRQSYKEAYQDSQVTLSKWCQSNSLDYQCARKQIKVREIKAECKSVIHAKRQNVIPPQPQKANNSSFTQGNQVARKHGAYAALINEDDLAIAQQVESIEEELLVCRARLASVMKKRNILEYELREALAQRDHESYSRLGETLRKLSIAEDRAIARIESLCVTLSKLARNEQVIEKDKAQTVLLEQTIEQNKSEKNKDDTVVYNISW